MTVYVYAKHERSVHLDVWKVDDILTDREQGEADSEAERPGHHGTPQP